jgi:hypothetical protein
LEDPVFVAGEKGRQGTCLENIKTEDATVAMHLGQIESQFRSYAEAFFQVGLWWGWETRSLLTTAVSSSPTFVA